MQPPSTRGSRSEDPKVNFPKNVLTLRRRHGSTFSSEGTRLRRGLSDGGCDPRGFLEPLSVDRVQVTKTGFIRWIQRQSLESRRDEQNRILRFGHERKRSVL